MKSIKRIIIVNSYYYCGGTLVLSELCRCLRKQNYDARLFLLHSFPTGKKDLQAFSKKALLFINIKLAIAILLNHFFPTKNFNKKYFPEYFQAIHLKQCKIQINPFFSNRKTIVLYPETVYGNPLKAKNVARWLLYYNRYPNDASAYGEKDMFFSYREIFNDSLLNPSQRLVKIFCFDDKLYKQTNFSKRSGTCYIIRKGRGRKDLPQKFDGIIIDPLPEEEKVKIFNQCEYCYCYDTQTFYSSIASICGCKTVVVPEPGKTRKDYRGGGDNPHYGIAYGDSKEEMEWAEKTKKELVDSLNHEESNTQNAQKLINYINTYFLE